MTLLILQVSVVGGGNCVRSSANYNIKIKIVTRSTSRVTSALPTFLLFSVTTLLSWVKSAIWKQERIKVPTYLIAVFSLSPPGKKRKSLLRSSNYHYIINQFNQRKKCPRSTTLDHDPRLLETAIYHIFKNELFT